MTFRRISAAYIPTVPSEQTLWRVMDLAKLRTLARGGLWLARLDQFGTAYEGSLPEANRLGLLEMLPEETVTSLQSQYTLTRDLRAYACCWHMNSGDPPAELWAEFDGSGCGVAIRTTVPLLRV